MEVCVVYSDMLKGAAHLEEAALHIINNPRARYLCVLHIRLYPRRTKDAGRAGRAEGCEPCLQRTTKQQAYADRDERPPVSSEEVAQTSSSNVAYSECFRHRAAQEGGLHQTQSSW